MRLDCECGYVALATYEEEVVRLAQAHARDAHSIELTAEQVLAARRAESSPGVPGR